MASEPQRPRTSARTSTIQQLAIGISVVTILLLTVLGSGVLTMQEGKEQAAQRFTETSIPTSTSIVVPTATATQTSSPTATTEPTGTTEPTNTPAPPTETPRPSETPTTPASPTETPIPTATQVATPTALSPTALPTSAASCSPPANWVLYTVQSGDTVTRLAFLHETTVSAIIQGNCLQSVTLYGGQLLYLPPRQVAPTITPTRCVPRPPAGWVLYTIQSGDTLSGLALSRRTTQARIQQVNCLPSSMLYAGQKIYLPAAPPTATPTWTLVPTETTVPTATATPTQTTQPTPTSTVPVTATATVAPTATTVPTSTVAPPTATASPTVGATPTATETTVPPTATETTVPPTATETTVPPTATATETVAPPTETPTATATATPVPTATETPTP